jgi:membrane associated rhomboid family serine protease
MIPIRDVIPSRTTPVVTLGLIALNVLVFVVQSGLTGRGLEMVIFNFALVPADFSIVTVFTSMLLHGGLAHLAGNMLFLWIFGDNIEDRLGHGRFLFFYLICGFVAALAQTALDPTSSVPMVGASGAIAGVMGAYLILFPHSRVVMLFPFPPIVFELPAVWFLVMWFAVQFLNGVGTLSIFGGADLSGGVAFWAHVTGFVTGAVLVRIMRRPERMAVDWWDTHETGDQKIRRKVLF